MTDRPPYLTDAEIAEIYVKERAWALAVAANQLQIGIAR